MARTVAGTRIAELTDRPPHPDRASSCSFCTTPTPEGTRHDYCPEDIHTTAPGRKDDKVWECQCWKEGHPQ